MSRVMAELSDNKKRIEVRFSFDPEVMRILQRIPGNKFKPKEKDPHKGEAYFYFPSELTLARRLQQALGKRLLLGPVLTAWGWEVTKQEDVLIDLALSESEELERLPKVLTKLYEAIHLGPLGRDMSMPERLAALKKPPSFQSADVKFLATASNPLNGNHPGLGKTIEHIAGIFEEGREEGSHLVLAPVSSLETVWLMELETWQSFPVLVAQGGRRERDATLDLAVRYHEAGEPFWLIINWKMAQLTGVYEMGLADYTGKRKKILIGTEETFPQLYGIEWMDTNVDEIHKAGFRNNTSLMAMGINKVKAGKRYAMSGTPIGGKPINLWYILHYLNPDDFSNKWRWAEEWLDIETVSYETRQRGPQESKKIGDISSERELEFYRALTPYMLRRTKEECLPWLPKKQYIPKEVRMGPKQQAQYEEFARAAEVRIEEETLSATSILAEYTRLKQFAISLNTVEYYEEDGETKFRPIPTQTSCKLDILEELLEERGFFDGDPKEQVVIFSQFSRMVDMVVEWLEQKKVPAVKMTGDTNRKGERRKIQDAFQAGEGPKVIVMTTTAGGVSINLDMADAVIFLDETWEPDDQEQAEDRVHRASRNHQVTVYRIITKDTIEEYIKGMNIGKASVNRKILDLRRDGLRATKAQPTRR